MVIRRAQVFEKLHIAIDCRPQRTRAGDGSTGGRIELHNALIQIPECRQFPAAIAHVRNVEHHVGHQLLLDAEIPLLHVSSSLA